MFLCCLLGQISKSTLIIDTTVKLFTCEGSLTFNLHSPQHWCVPGPPHSDWWADPPRPSTWSPWRRSVLASPSERHTERNLTQGPLTCSVHLLLMVFLSWWLCSIRKTHQHIKPYNTNIIPFYYYVTKVQHLGNMMTADPFLWQQSKHGTMRCVWKVQNMQEVDLDFRFPRSRMDFVTH